MSFDSPRCRSIASVVLVASLAFVVLAGPRRNAVAGPMGTDDVVVSPGVRNAIANSGSARVIVEVRLPTPFVPEGALGTGAAVLAQRANIARAQAQVRSRLRGLGHTVLHQFVAVPYLVLEVEADALSALETSTFDVRRVVEDEMYGPLLAQSVPLIGGNQAWAQGFDGTGQVIAILDTGVDGTHPFLTGKVVSEACYSTNSAGQTASLCPNGEAEQTGPGSGVNCPLDIPVCWHGTHVAGIATGNGPGAGVAFSGVAKGAQIVSVQLFSRGTSPPTCGGPPPCLTAFLSDIMKGLDRIYFLRDQYAFAAVNLSVGGGSYGSYCDEHITKPVIDNLRSAGIATVIAAGNNGWINLMSAPACVSSAVSVSSTTEGDVVSTFSNVTSFLSLFAPGEPITSSYPGAQYHTDSGSSFATPHVTGAFALLKQAAPNATVTTLLSALQQTGIPITDTREGGFVTKPRIRIADALALVGAAPGNTLTVVRAGTGSGTVTSGNGIIHCGAFCSAAASAGTQVTLTAAAAANSTFTSWAGCTSANGATCNVTGPATVTATFTLTGAGVALGVVVAGSGTGTVTSNDGQINCGATCSGAYAVGSGVTLTAAAAGATFKQWGGACSGSAPTCVLTMSAAQSVTATFTENFTDGTGPAGTIGPNETVIKAVHVLELRAAVDNLRAERGLAPFNWTDPNLTVGVTPAKGIHVLDLRSGLAAVCTLVPGKCTGYVDGTLPSGQIVIQAVHLNELRANVRALE